MAGSIGDYNAVLLANHGLVTVGRDLETAFAVAEEIELVARIYYQAKCIGEPVILPAGEMANVIDRFADYGKKTIPPGTGHCRKKGKERP